jgi:rhamnose utilization protein RhaD (predicted bifunctional aldolase and dehydrogenase)
VAPQRSWPYALDKISHEIGVLSNLVQGPGGNTSWKQNDELWVKASGLKLKDAIKDEIFCKVSLKNPTVNLNVDEKTPSIESILHSARSETYVIHVHSIGTVSLGCRKNLDKDAVSFLNEMNLGILDYQRPGENLAKSLGKRSNDFAERRGVILANHGIVIWGENIWELYSYLLQIESSLEQIYPTDRVLLNKIREETLESYLGERYLTPDHAVFAREMKETANNKASNWLLELREALEVSVSKVKGIEEINFISREETKFLQNWNAEKSRKRMNS